MKRFLSCFCGAVVLAVICNVAPVSAQTASAGNIAVIDIPVIFKNHALFKKQMDELKGEVDAAEQSLTQFRDQMKAMVDELQGYKSGTPEYKTLEEKIANLQADLQVKVGMQKKDFMEREARVYFNTYNQITETVSTFAQRHNISLVLRYNSNPIDPQNRQSVLEGVNRPVIYQNKIDITYDVLRILNNGVAQNAAVGGSQVPVPR